MLNRTRKKLALISLLLFVATTGLLLRPCDSALAQEECPEGFCPVKDEYGYLVCSRCPDPEEEEDVSSEFDISSERNDVWLGNTGVFVPNCEVTTLKMALNSELVRDKDVFQAVDIEWGKENSNGLTDGPSGSMLYFNLTKEQKELYDEGKLGISYTSPGGSGGNNLYRPEDHLFNPNDGPNGRLACNALFNGTYTLEKKQQSWYWNW